MTAVCCPYHCVERGREFRGSKHFGPISDADQTGDEITPGKVAAWQAFAAVLAAPFSSITGTYQPVVVSRKLSQYQKDPTTIVGSDVNGVSVNLTLGTMRRRKEKTVR